MTQTDPLLTGEDLLAVGDMGSCELIDGRIMPMRPTGWRHGRIENLLGFELTLFVRQKQLGWVVVGEVGIYIRRDPDTIRAADVAFLSRKRVSKEPAEGFLEVAPEVVIEVMSPTDRWQDLRKKIEDYFSIDVCQVWVIEPELRNVLVFDSPTQMRKFTEADHFEPDGVLKGLSLKVADLFEGS